MSSSMHRMRLFFVAVALGFLAGTASADAVRAQEIAADKYSRLVPAAGGREARLETAVWSFRSKVRNEVTVDLVSVIHLGEKDYFRRIDKLLDGYDVVLYECVSDTKSGKPRKTAYLKSARALGFDGQGEHINYDRKHFVHADMTRDEMKEAFRKRGLPFNEPNDEEMAKLLSTLSPFAARWLIATKMTEKVRDKPASDAVVISERNQVALATLAKALAAGHKRIAVFYGVNHMPDFERHLTTRFGMTPAGSRWLTAWRLPPA